MGIDLPGWAADTLNEFGYTWPKTDETKVLELARHWVAFGGSLAGVAGGAAGAAAGVVTANTSRDIEAFHQRWTSEGGGHAVLRDGETGTHAVSGALIVCGAVVLALKINVIIQVTILIVQVLEALLAGPETAGASLLWIPVQKKLTNIAISILITEAMRVILG